MRGCVILALLLAACAPTGRAPPAAPVAPPAPRATATRTTDAGKVEAPRPKAPAAPPVASRPAAVLPSTPAKPATPPLDLTSLEKRLRETQAIGTFTKLAVKNDVDDLLDKFRAVHAGRTPPTLADLRQNFNLLVMKILSLLQDGDPALASAIAASREAIWGVLSDKSKFAAI